MARVCKTGGEIFISAFSEEARTTQLENYRRIGLNIIKEEPNAIFTKEGLYPRRFTKEDPRKLFDSAGLDYRIIKICPISYIACAGKKGQK